MRGRPCPGTVALARNALERLRAGTVIVADRNFARANFSSNKGRGGCFVIRATRLDADLEARGKRRRLGRIATGMVHEQGMELQLANKTLSAQAGSHRTDRPTENGDTEIHIITNLSAESKRRAASGGDLRHALDGWKERSKR